MFRDLINQKTNFSVLAVLGIVLIFQSGVLAQCPGIITGSVTDGVAFGMQVGAAGDVDGDGVPDYLVATRNFPGYPAEVRVFSGSSDQILQTYRQLYDYYYKSGIAGLGDVNGDGYGDILIGTVIFSGLDKSVLFSVDDVVVPSSAPAISYRVGHVLGDLDQDGVKDFAISSRLTDANGADYREIVFYSGASRAVLHVMTSELGDALFGNRVVDAGDVNGDGSSDFLLQTLVDNGGVLDFRILVISGADASELYSFSEADVSGSFNRGMSGVGDFNADGFDDFAFVSSTFTGENDPILDTLHIRSGRDGVSLMKIVPEPASVGLSYFGYALAGGGDINGDGVPDVVVGGHYYGLSADSRNGAVFVYSGIDGELIGRMFGEESFSEFGRAVAIVGDVNGDGRDDILVGSHHLGTLSTGTLEEKYLHTGKTYLFNCLTPCCIVAGDANGDKSMNVADVTFGIQRIFGGGAAPACMDAADANGDHAFNVADVTMNISRIFSGGQAPICGEMGY